MDSPDEVFSTDACLAGCGGVCDDQYFHGVFPPFIFEQNLYIRSLEVLTIVVALKLWGTCWTGLSITVLCDNKAAVTVVNTARCGNHFMNSCLRDICYFATLYEFEVCPFTSLKSVLYKCIESFCGSSVSMGFLQRVQRDRYHWQDAPVPDAMFRFNGTFQKWPFTLSGVSELSRLRQDLKHSQRSA